MTSSNQYEQFYLQLISGLPRSFHQLDFIEQSRRLFLLPAISSLRNEYLQAFDKQRGPGCDLFQNIFLTITEIPLVLIITIFEYWNEFLVFWPLSDSVQSNQALDFYTYRHLELKDSNHRVSFTGTSLLIKPWNLGFGLSMEHENIFNFGSQNFTLTCGFKTVQRGAWKRLLTKRGPVALTWYSLALMDGYPRLEISPSINIVSRLQCADGKWHQVTSTRNGQSFSLYIDGILTSQANFDINIQNTGEIAIGYWEKEAYDGSNFIGEIRNVGIIARCLDSDEIATLFV